MDAPARRPAAEWGALGNALQREGRHAEAAEAYRSGLALDPDLAPMRSNLGNSLQALGRFEEAVAEHRRAVALRPEWGALHGNLGAALHRLGEAEEAVAAYATALALQPAAPPPVAASLIANLATSLCALNRHAEALPHFEQALGLAPAQADAAWNYGLALLTLGRFAEGWPYHERRLEQPYKRVLERGGLPMWDGNAPLAGKRLLVQIEQGFGDLFQMARYLPVLQGRGASCVVHASETFHALLARSFPGVAFLPMEIPPPAADYRLPTMSLPFVLKTATEADIPRTVPYLAPDPEKAEAWSARIVARSESRRRPVGLVWKGNPEHVDDRNRSASVKAFAPLLDRDDLLWVILQKGETEAERAFLRGRRNVLLPEPGEIATYDDTAAAMAALDLVITVDSSPAHLAGGLGRPLWLLLPFSADWRWQTGRDDSPWYPTARLFRQEKRRDWAGLVARLGEALSRG